MQREKETFEMAHAHTNLKKTAKTNIVASRRDRTNAQIGGFCPA